MVKELRDKSFSVQHIESFPRLPSCHPSLPMSSLAEAEQSDVISII